MTPTTDSLIDRSGVGARGPVPVTGPLHEVDRGAQSVPLEGLTEATTTGTLGRARSDRPESAIDRPGGWAGARGRLGRSGQLAMGGRTFTEGGRGHGVRRAASYHRHPAPVTIRSGSAAAARPQGRGGRPSARRRHEWRGRWGRCPRTDSQRRPGDPMPTDPARRLPLRGGHGRIPDRGRLTTGPGSRPTTGWPGSRSGRVEPSGNAVGFWDRPEESLDRAAALGCNSFRLGVEWARVVPTHSPVDPAPLAIATRTIVAGCVDRGLEPLVTLHHFTHPAWLGEDLWLRPDAPDRYRSWAELAVDALAPSVRHWVTVNEINALAIGSWLLGMFPPGRVLAFDDAAIAVDNLLTAHVRGLRGHPPVAGRRGGHHQQRVPERVRATIGMLTDVLLARSMPGSIAATSAAGSQSVAGSTIRSSPRSGAGEHLLRRLGTARSPYGATARSRRGGAMAADRPGCPGERWRRSTAVRTSARSMPSASTTTTRWPPGTSGCPAVGPPAAATLFPPGSCGTTFPIPPGSLDGSGPSGPWPRASRSGWSRTGCATGCRNGRSHPRLDGWDRPPLPPGEPLGGGGGHRRRRPGPPGTGTGRWSTTTSGGRTSRASASSGSTATAASTGWVGWTPTRWGTTPPGAYRRIIAGLRAGDRSVLGPG